MTDLAAGQATARRTVRVLLVEDDADLLSMLATYLGLDEGVEVAGRARNGQEALETLATTECDVAVVDLAMPVMGGATLLPLLAAGYPQVGRIVYSAQADVLAEGAVQALCADAVVSKSAPVTDLKRVIAQVAVRPRP